MPTPRLPDRQCGECTVCCVHMTIDDPALRKPQGEPCRHIAQAGGCSIYHSRPGTCRQFECGWKRYKWVKPGLRPDRSGILIHIDEVSDSGLTIVITLLTDASLNTDGLAETVAAAVAAGKLVTFSIPGSPGHTATSGRIDAALAPAVARRDKAAVLATLRNLHRQALSTGGNVPIRALR